MLQASIVKGTVMLNPARVKLEVLIPVSKTAAKAPANIEVTCP